MVFASISVFVGLILDIKFKGTIFNLIVIARRSRHHAGTRYIKRGIDEQGFAANFV